MVLSNSPSPNNIKRKLLSPFEVDLVGFCNQDVNAFHVKMFYLSSVTTDLTYFKCAGGNVCFSTYLEPSNVKMTGN